MAKAISRGLSVAGLLAAGLASGSCGRGAEPGSVRAWPVGPFEVRLAFDRPTNVDPKALVGKAIEFVEEGAKPDEVDRRGSLRIAAAVAEDDGATLRLTTDPHPRDGRYSLAFAGGSFIYGVRGVEAAWSPAGAEPGSRPAWVGVWPGVDPGAARKDLADSPAHRRGWDVLAKPGTLTLTAQITLPEGAQTIRVRSSGQVAATLDGLDPTPPENGEDAKGEAVFEVEATGLASLLSLTVATGPDHPLPTITVLRKGPDDPAPTPLKEPSFLLPWVPPAPVPTTTEIALPALSGGDPARGALVFKGAEAKCSSCHKVRGEGGEVGPDLSVLVGRDRASVYRDIAEPSARIHPGFVAYTVATKDGRIFAGTVRAEGADAIKVTDNEAKAHLVARQEIEDFRPSATSAMPVGLAGAIGEAALRDLIAFLTTPPTAGKP